MSKKERVGFSVEDIKALRYLAIILGLIGVGLIWVAGPDEPLIVGGFIAVVMLAVVAAIYGLRCLQKKKEPNQAPEPTAPSGRGSS